MFTVMLVDSKPSCNNFIIDFLCQIDHLMIFTDRKNGTIQRGVSVTCRCFHFHKFICTIRKKLIITCIPAIFICHKPTIATSIHVYYSTRKNGFALDDNSMMRTVNKSQFCSKIRVTLFFFSISVILFYRKTTTHDFIPQNTS